TGKGTKVKDLAKMIEIFYNKKCNVNWGGIPYPPMDTMYDVAPIAKNIEILDWKTTLAIEERLD
ncbi:hypothetical protein J9332_38820, partial [Aquimarina celericrescens]|nr:hypothetical protein [Aquimarina celericrescens]